MRFDGQEDIIDFSGPTSQYQIPFAAFYADCEHEIEPITSWNRVCLVYNLIQNRSRGKIKIESLKGHVDRLTTLLKNGRNSPTPRIVLLGHQYTPSNFTMESLKLNGRIKAEALIRAAEKSDYYAKPCLVTSFQTGALEIDYDMSSSGYGCSSYYDDEDLENGTMGEVFDEYVEIKHWMGGGVPSLDDINFREDDLITSLKLNEGEPVEKNAEGYTGNAGMEMEYWYHYGAIVLWPKKSTLMF